MDRTQLLAQVSEASSLHQISSAIAAIRTWLLDNPDDESMREAMRELIRLERERWTYARS